MRKTLYWTLILALLLALSSCGAGDSGELDKAKADLSTAQETITELEKQVSIAQGEADALRKELEEAKAELESKTSDYQKLKSEYDAYKEEMAPFEELAEEEAEARKIAAQKEIEAAKAEEEAKAAEEAEEKERKEKQGYDTGITYEQLARTPDDYEGEKVKFKGEVLQVLEGSDEIQIRLAVDGNYSNVIFCGYEPSIVSSRVLEDDTITVYGVSVGLYSYESTMSGTITIPAVYVEKIDQ